MNTNSNHELPARLLAVAAILFSLSVDVQAADDTWSGNGATANWSDTGNWDAVPVNGDDTIFSGTTQLSSVNDITGLSLGWLWLNGSGYSITGNPITLTGGITNSFDGNTVGVNLTLGAPQSFSSQSGTLVLGAGVGLAATITNNGNALTFTDAGDFLLQGAITGAGSLIMEGSGTLTITNRQPLTGGIFANAGTITFSTKGNLNFGGAETPSLITINTNGTVLGDGTHAIGGGTSVFINRGIWELNDEDYKQNLTMWDGTIEPGPSPNTSGGELRVGSAGSSGGWTWYVTNSVAGSTISSPLNTIGAGVNLTLDVARGAAASDLAISGVILGAGNITVVRNGITTLSGQNTQTGTFTIAGGTVVLTGTLWSTVITVASNAVFDISGNSFSLNTNSMLTGVGTVIGTLNDQNSGVTGAVLSPGGNNAAGTLTMGGLSLSGNGLVLNFDLANTIGIGGGTNDLLIVTNFSANAGVTNTVNISFLNGTPQVGGAYTLIKYGNGFSGDPSQFLTAAASRYVYTFTNDTTAGAIKVIVTGTPGNLVWKGDGSTNVWDVATTTNWFNGAPNKDVFLQGDNATFSDIGSNNTPINLAAAVQSTIVTVNATKDYVFNGSGKITGGGKLVKSNSGNLTLLTGNDFTGGGSLNGSGVVNVGNGGATGALGSGSLTNNTKVTFFENASTTYAGNMSGTGTVVSFMPAATLTLTGTNTFTGGLVALNGTTQIGNNTAGSSVAGNITNYSTLNLYRSDAFTNKNYITSAGNTLEYGNGDVNVRGAGGMTVDGSGSINLLPQGSLSIGQSAAGFMTVNPGAVINIGLNFLLGNPNAAGNFGVVVQNGGTINVGNNLRIGHWDSEVSFYTMNGGVLNVPNNDLAVGWDGRGLMTLANGTVNCRTLSVDDNGISSALNGTNSTFTMTGGLLNIGTGGIGGATQTNAVLPTILLSGGTIGTLVPSTLITAGWSSVMNLRLTNGTPTFDSSNSTITLSGILSGNGGITKQGAGYLNLNATNSFTGTATVAAGTLQGSGIVVGPVVVQSGANLSAGSTFATGTLTASNVTVNTGGNVVIDASSTAATSDLLYIKGVLNLDTTTPLFMNFLGGTPYTGGAYTVVSNLLARTGHLVLAPAGLTRYAATVDESNPNRIQVSFSGANASLVWQGGASTNWNVNTDANWLNAGAADKYYQSDAVIFDDTGITKSNVNLATPVTPANVTVNASGNYAFTGNSISGLTGLTKNGSGRLTLLNSNAYTGITTIAGGTLQVGNGATSGYLTGGTVADYGSLVFNRSDTVNFNGVINGPGTLTQAGSGTLLITATQNHYGGSTISSGGTVQLGNGALGDSGSLGNGMVTNNGTVNFYRLSSIAVATPYTGGGNFNFLGTGNTAQSAYSLNATNTFTGPVTLNYARIQSGAGAQSFGSPSTIAVGPGSQVYAVATPVSSIYNIPLVLAGTGWQDGLGALRMENGGTWSGPITLVANTRFGVNNATTNIITGTIGGNYELETYGGNAGAALVLSPSSANTYNALRVSIGTAGSKTIAGNNNAIPNNIPLTMNGGTLWLNGFSKSFSPFLNLSSSSSVQNGSTNSAATITLAPVLGSTTYNGTFADGGTQPLNVTFTQTPGLWTLALPTASPNWTGNLTNNGGTISSGTQNTPFGSQGVFGRSIVGNTGAVFVTTINNVLNGYNGNVVLNNSTWICNRYISMNPSAGSLYLANSTMTGTNSSDGNYETWQLPSIVTVRGTSPSYMLGAGSSPAYDLQSGGTTFDVADATGNANSDLIVGGGSSTTFLHSPANTTLGGSLTKTGPGTLELDGANTYTGPTTIANGTLRLGASASIAASGNVGFNIASGATFDVSAVTGGLTLISGQTLGGSGTVNGSVSDASGTVIQPGGNGTAGTLTINNNLTLGGNGSLNIDLSNNSGSGNDLIQVNGNLTLASGSPATPVNFNFLSGAPALGTPYTLIQCGSISGTAAIAFTNSPSRYMATYSQMGNSIVVIFSGSASNLIWTGTDPVVSATWDVATSTNWFDGSGGNIFYQNDTVKFDDTSVNTTVNLGVTVTPAAITVDSTNNYTITGGGAIAGNTGITKNNTNTLTLSTANTFTGPVVVNAGVLAEGNNSALPQNASVIVTNGAQFDFAGFGGSTTRNYSFLLGGSGPNGSGALVDSGGSISGNASVASVSLTTNTTIGGSGRWDMGSGQSGTVLNGNGYNLTVNNGSSGMSMRPQIITNVASITLTNGLMWYEGFSQTNPWTATTTNYVLPGASLGIYGGQAVSLPIVLTNATILNQGSGTPLWLSPITLQGTNVFNNSAAQNFSGVISGPGAISIGGGSTTVGTIPGFLTFSNANTFAGGVVISNAPVTVGLAAAVSGYAAVMVTSSNGLGSGPVILNLSQMTTNAMTNTARAMEFNITGGGVIPNAIVLPISGTTGVTNLSLQGRDSSSVFTLSGQISGGYVGLTNWLDFGDSASSGVMRLANQGNNFVANIYGDRGVLAITGDGCLGNAANLLKLDQASVNGGLRFDAPAINVAHNIIANSSMSLDVFGDNNGDGIAETANSATISSIISGGGAFAVRCGVNVTPASFGTLILSGNNTFSGALTINPFVKVVASHANALGTTAGGTTVNGGGTLSLNLGGTYASESLTLNGSGVGGVGALENLSGVDILNGNITLASASTIGLTGGSLTLGGIISGAFPLTITGVSTANTLTLAGMNTYSAGTIINGGAVLVNGSLPVGNAVRVSGGALGGSGTINGPVVTQAGAVLQPGGGGPTVGKLIVNNTLGLGGNIVMFLNKTTLTNSAVAGISTVVYGGVLSVTNLSGTLTTGDTFKLFSAQDYLGSFTSITLPTLGANLSWSNSLTLNGSIQVITNPPSVNPNPTNISFSISGNQLTLAWPADHAGWRLLAQTNNLLSGVSSNTNDWGTVSGSAATNQVIITVDPAKPTDFYRLVYP